MPIGVQIIAAPWREDIALAPSPMHWKRDGVVFLRRGREEYEMEVDLPDVLTEVMEQFARATRRRWSETTSPFSMSCSVPMAARLRYGGSAKISTAMTRSWRFRAARSAGRF